MPAAILKRPTVAGGVLYLCTFCPLAAPWNHRRATPAVRRLHRHAVRHFAWRHCVLVKWPVKTLFACLWPLNAIWQTVRNTLRFGPMARAEVGKGRTRQAFEQIVLAVRDFIPPYTYYAQRLYDDARRGRASLYLSDYEMRGLFACLNDFYRKSDTPLVENKRKFYDFCVRHGLAAPRLIAEFRRGRMERLDPGPEPLPRCDLVAKPTTGRRGRMLQRWLWIEADRYRDEQGRVLSAEDLVRRLCETSKTIHLLLQPRLTVHPRLAQLTAGSLATTRIVTARPDDGRIEVLLAMFKMPLGTCLADNYSSGNSAAAVDPASGTLGKAIARSLELGRFVRHPDTNGLIEGVELPCWTEAKELVVRAHGHVEGYYFLGWDVALTADGPLLLEANDSWAAELPQRTHDRPLGAMRFAELCEAGFARRS